jgi:hypothetical protein
MTPGESTSCSDLLDDDGVNKSLAAGAWMEGYGLKLLGVVNWGKCYITFFVNNLQFFLIS